MESSILVTRRCDETVDSIGTIMLKNTSVNTLHKIFGVICFDWVKVSLDEEGFVIMDSQQDLSN